MSGPLVSVCILAYNNARGVQRTLRYMQVQTYPHLEILVADDASPQPEIATTLEPICQADPRIRFFRRPQNLGIIGNHRFLLEQAQGTYLLWACQDDHWHPDYIRVCVNALEQRPEAILAVGKAWVLDTLGRAYPYREALDTMGKPPARRFKQVCKEIRWWNNAFYGLFRRSVLEAAPLRDSFGFDLIHIALLSLKGPFIQLPEVYFTKQAGGSGNQLASNLQAIKVSPKWWMPLWPALSVWLNLQQGLKQSGVLRYLRSSFPLLFSRPFGRPAWLRAVRRWLRTQRKAASHNLRRGYATIFYRDNKREALRTYPWIHPQWLETPNKSELRLIPFALNISWPQHQHLLNHFFGLKALEGRGGKLSISQDNIPTLSLAGMNFLLPDSMSIEVLKEVILARVYDAQLPEGSVVLDVGMNTGITSLWLARQPEVQRIYAYEPMPDLFDQAQRLFALNEGPGEKISPQPFGLSAYSRTGVFAYAQDYGVYSSEFFAPPAAESMSVEAPLRGISEELARITAVHPQAPLILKLDAEGAEYELIPALAADGWLSRFDFLMIEWHQKGTADLLPHLEKAGFHTLLRQEHADRGMIYALAPDAHPLPLFQASLHDTY